MVSYAKLIEIVNDMEVKISLVVNDDDLYTDLCNIFSKNFFNLIDLGLNSYSNILIKETYRNFIYEIITYGALNNINLLDLYIILDKYINVALI